MTNLRTYSRSYADDIKNPPLGRDLMRETAIVKDLQTPLSKELFSLLS